MLDAAGRRVRGHGRAAVFGALAGGAARTRALPRPRAPGSPAAGPVLRSPCRPVALHFTRDKKTAGGVPRRPFWFLRIPLLLAGVYQFAEDGPALPIELGELL